MAKGFFFDMTSCIGCKTCQIACKDKNDLPIGTLFRTVMSYETGDFPMPGVFHFSGTCNHCEDPICVKNCPTGAMYKTEDGPVLHDNEICIGCETCVNSCPYGVPKLLTEKGISGKCDTCVAIRAGGNDPQCVAACPMRALEFGEINDLKKAHPDAISITELPFMPKSDTKPTTLVMAKKLALEEEAHVVII
jgi:anaerobic dimethyl sulfoxide reductase subunit B (iron-sulfur subunit)